MTNEERTYWIMAWYERLSDEDRRALSSVIQKSGDSTVEDAKKTIESKLDSLSSQIEKENRLPKGILANVLGNYISDASIYILNRLLRLK
jgi:hypothetical protein